MPKHSLPPAIFLMGPTASGKTALSVKLANALDGEIISVDSALVFRDMNIGTAKPTLEERGGIPHHLLDILDPSESFSTGQFRTQALTLMAAITGRGKIPILVGGTMLYFNALFNGLAVLPEANPLIRAQLDLDLERSGKEALHNRLAEIDPLAAARIHPNDPQRVQRALEVFAISGKTLSSFFDSAQSEALPYQKIKLIVAPSDRKILHEIIAQRFHVMLEQGFINEVEKLYHRGNLNEKMSSIRAVGYRQAWAYLQGADDFEAMTEKAIIATRQLAKRQFTWLRKETDATLFQSGQTNLFDATLAFTKHCISS
ncbi:MAG: tRNA (adenosine(37)-N6)-dimethylallyltransferase MiaA [Methylococcales bacterium]|nr:tRNA (adenosine(37)-N6)-dimethylallyltransferase [uncultured bacterium]MCX7106448.1 tRNA (adenosine(37)-N6)-dimethylallyltransferase MiaA [Methylococcales bacterium]